MRIALVVNAAWNVVNFRMPLLRALRDAGHQLLVVCPEDPAVVSIKQEGFRFLPLTTLERKGQNPLTDMRLLRELARIYRQEQIDLALQYTIKPVIYGSLAAPRTGTRVINTITGLGYAFINDGITQKIVKRLYRLALARAYRTFFQNEDDLNLFQQQRLIDPGSALLVPGSGVNTRHFGLTEITPEQQQRVLFIGRLLVDKGIYEFVEAASRLREKYPALTFTVVGAIDPNNPASVPSAVLEQWVNAGIIDYRGQLSDVRTAIAEAGLVVLPSYREGLPRVLLEAGAMGRPVVTTDVPGCRAVARPGLNGWIVPHKRADKLAEAIAVAVQLPHWEFVRIGLNGRKVIEDHYAEEHVIAVYRELIDDLNAD
ncbi:glycosyltransferase family 4 protein [Lewinella sp. W8]|uniref:glycosyltransferase family 4 protein n=1 Tax=Lewinella sp. W8 TaxID=2528208 RepID=UPI0015666A1E|nr:glycosyltransferase family 4 protein [Lewinella sp. W8]